MPIFNAALDDAFSSIMKIASGSRTHPIIAKFIDWLSKGGNMLKKTTDFRMTYEVPILPGDTALIEPYLIDMQRRLSRDPSMLTIDPHALVFGVAAFLFDLVVLRNYLERGPKDDITIYNIIIGAGDHSMQKAENKVPLTSWIIRRSTLPEQALAACQGVNDTVASNDTWRFALANPECIKFTKDLPLRYDAPLASMITDTGDVFVWPETNVSGLTGGPPYEQPQILVPRPKRRC
ncbi:hypothetical protein A0H81_08092 [Grifola frondosa]|uniref:Uncharacterized protein n=1 Tax=Grifola frondosa TaxID=5627 RepID=A0A1C7M5G2_GRIFR|nr:hypothetical protein A0H81_08092 [Grifola frondosa]